MTASEAAKAKERINREKQRVKRLDTVVKQIEVLTKKHRRPPTVRELADAVGRNVSNVHKDMHELKAAGRIHWATGQRGTLRVK